MGFLQLGYKRIHYTDSKPSDEGAIRETFVLTHGLGSSENYYGGIVPQLTSQGFRVVSFDTTGAARSPHTQIEQSIQTLSADVIGIIDALEIEKAVVVGHSMGGIVAANLAAEYNDRIVAAVLIGPVYPSDAVADVFQKRIETVEKHGMQPMADTIPGGATGKNASSLAKAFIRELLLGQDKWGYVSNCRVIASAKPPKFGNIKIPVLIIAGEEDKSAPLDGCKKMFEEMGTEEKKLEVLPGVGHWHCLEAPDAVSKKILEFYHEIQ